MELILLPKESKQLTAIYQRALSRADELYLFSAYLTEWGFRKQLNRKCKRIGIYFGIDFKITRKQAVRNVLKWLPMKHKCSLYCVENGGYHPKMLVWKEEEKYFLVLGSSNLTEAGFETNIEANSFQSITLSQFKKILMWKINLIDTHIRVVNEEWVKNYKESKIVKKPSHHPPSPLKLLPKVSQSSLYERRAQISAFARIRKPLEDLIRKCAAGKISNLAFWENMYFDLWGQSNARIMGKGFEISAKHANWKVVCKCLIEIFSADDTVRDVVVRDSIDLLAKRGIPVREAWLSEMLAHFYPKQYPLLNWPPRHWLIASHYRRPRGATEGAEYIDIATKFRAYLNESQRYRNLLELDLAIQCKYPKPHRKR